MKKLLLLTLLLTFSFGFSQSAAPIPPARVATDVRSVYSGAYSDAFGTVTWANAVDVVLDGNATKFTNNANFAQGAFANNSIVGMTHMHVDIYSTTPNTSQMKVQVNAAVSGSYATPNNVWTSLDLPLSVWSNPTTCNLVNLQGYAGPGNFYFDNVYFYKPVSNPAPTFGTFTVPAKLVGDADFNITPPSSNSTVLLLFQVVTLM